MKTELENDPGNTARFHGSQCSVSFLHNNENDSGSVSTMNYRTEKVHVTQNIIFPGGRRR